MKNSQVRGACHIQNLLDPLDNSLSILDLIDDAGLHVVNEKRRSLGMQDLL